ncbi:MAG: type II secretion system ATPase GspE [Dissulfurispiraceae bacterium]|jgi:general secretion pathway protein E|nr:type II secretion system ATPase GspE [Dissulfurispiraceae bacterium]
MSIVSLADILLERELVTQTQLDIAEKELQKNSNKSLADVLVELGFLARDSALEAISSMLGIRYLKFSDFPKQIPDGQYPALKFMKQYKIVPIGSNNGRLRIAVANPFDNYAIEAIKCFSNSPVDVCLSSDKDIEEAIEQYFSSSMQMSSIMEGIREDQAEEADNTREDVHHLRDMALEAPVIKLVNMFLTKAIEDRASDVHLEAFESRVKVRYRIDGVLVEAESIPKKLQAAIISRIKIMSRLNIAERRLPQDGRIKLRVSGREIDLRISTLPTLYGESVVMRILDRGSSLISLEDLGFTHALEQYKKIINMPHGMLLVTGPTGSGKTTTLYASLSRINSSERKIITIEDPVEYEVDGINQIHVKPKIGLTFASGLRHIVRQDPDVIMVGEIRDKETADIAVQSALTGHLVYSTLHTNDAPGAVTRLLDMGMESFLVASSLIGVLAQRLVRVICPDCKAPYLSNDDMLSKLGTSGRDIKGYLGRGCESCRNTGYKGRTGIFELMVVNDEIRQLILTKASADAIRQKAIEGGMQTLRECGLDKVRCGITTIDEVLRVTQEDTSDSILL